MQFLRHVLPLAVSAGVIWCMSGILINATDRVARRHRKPGFAVAFVILGFMTSISEISVATNATLERIPQVSAGNLLGASLVIFLLVIPLLAVMGNGIPMTKALPLKNLALVLLVVLLPSAMALDGHVSRAEGMLMVVLYILLLCAIRTKRTEVEVIYTRAGEGRVRKLRDNLKDLLKIVTAGFLIFGAGNILVNESVEIATMLTVPVSFVGLLLLSVGTNIPELVIAVRCVRGKHKDIAFGDYMGSAAMNTPTFGLLALANGSFAFERSEAVLTYILLSAGLILFFLFCRTKAVLSRREGLALMTIYITFVIFQLTNAARLAGEGTMYSGATVQAEELVD